VRNLTNKHIIINKHIIVKGVFESDLKK